MNGLHGIQPNRSDVRGFVHKRIGGAIVGGVKGFVRGGPTGVIGGAVGGFVAGGAPAMSKFQKRIARQQAERVARGQPALTGGPCPPGFNRGPGGGCIASVTAVPGLRGFVQRVIPGGETGFQVGSLPVNGGGVREGFPPFLDGAEAPGQATLGRFGAAMEPTVRTSQIRECERGMVLAVDGLCYNRRDVRNSERFWPRGRRPLLTGGEMRAISTAASAARKLQRKQKDLMELGLLPKPTARRRKGAVIGHKATLSHT